MYSTVLLLFVFILTKHWGLVEDGMDTLFIILGIICATIDILIVFGILLRNK